MMTQPYVSVVVTTYRRDDMLKQCLQSLVNQTLPLQEVVVVDDGGDGTARAVVEAFGERFRYLWQPNGGMQRARNAGSKEATGTWIAYLDDDDLWLPQRHALATDVIATGKVDLIAGDFIKFGQGWINETGVFDEIAHLHPGLWDGIEHDPNSPFSIVGSFPTGRLLPTHPFWGATLFVRRDLLDRINGWDETLRGVKSEDVDFVFRAIKHGQLGIIWPATMHYRSHVGNDSHSSLLNNLGRVHVWENLLKHQDLTDFEIETLNTEIDKTRHQILWSAFKERRYDVVITASKQINYQNLNSKEMLKYFLSQIHINILQIAN
jgi:glycosyltransferase involved in cell wall biosynthesis